MIAWLRRQWLAAASSYDHEKALATSEPLGTAIAAGALAAVLGAVGYVPSLARRAQIPHPWLPLLLTGLAACMTCVAWRYRCRGQIGVAATILDNGLYSAPLVYAAATATERWGLGLALTHGLMVLAFPSQTYSLTMAFALTMAAPLAIILPLTSSPWTVDLVLGCTFFLVLLLSYVTGRRRRLEHEHARLKEAVDATQRVADESMQMALTTTLLGLGHFLHELRNAQAAMQANLDFIRMGGDLSQEAEEALEDAIVIQHREQELVTETIDRLREQGRSSTTVFLLRELVDDVASNDDSGAKVSVEGFDQRFVLTGTPEHLRIVLTNLIRNASQAGAGEVRIHLRLEPSGRAVRILVHDDGPGLSSDDPEVLFRPFVSQGRPEGTGLGLYLCRRYVELFGGTIEVEESSLGGAGFRISLPGRVLAKERSEPPPAVVDDDRARLA